MPDNTETFEEFSKYAVEEFGDIFYIGRIHVSEETVAKINNEKNINLTVKNFEDYTPQVWLKSNICPKCKAELLGLFGSFDWGLEHGIGFCSHCNEVEFRY
jgi:hypothetical protein